MYGFSGRNGYNSAYYGYPPYAGRGGRGRAFRGIYIYTIMFQFVLQICFLPSNILGYLAVRTSATKI